MAEPIERVVPRATTDVRSADAFRDLIADHLDDAYRLAATILRDRSEAEDAVHEAAISAWLNVASIRDPGRFEAWFRRILINQCRDRLRARRRVRVIDVGLSIGSAIHPLEGDLSASTSDRERLRAAVDTLDPDDRVLIALRYGRDLTVPAIAEATGIRAGTVKSRLHRALARLRVALEEADR